MVEAGLPAGKGGQARVIPKLQIQSWELRPKGKQNCHKRGGGITKASDTRPDWQEIRHSVGRADSLACMGEWCLRTFSAGLLGYSGN